MNASSTIEEAVRNYAASVSEEFGAPRIGGRVMRQLSLQLHTDDLWRKFRRTNAIARVLADRHYSRQTVGAAEFMPPGRVLVLLALDEAAVWGVVENLDPAGGRQWRCSIFRREGGALASDLIRAATTLTIAYWRRRYGALPSVPLTTEVDPKRTRRKRDAGRCFRRAGWTYSHSTDRGLVVLTAPLEAA